MAEPEQLAKRVPRAVKAVVERLAQAGFESYPVGGCVRDLLIGRKVKDWDLTTDARPERVVDLFDKVIPTGLEHGTVTVLTRGLPIEVTTFRGESGYADGRHPDRVIFLDSLEEDLKRRDFTINAIALDLNPPRLVDPHGGRQDLERELIKAVGDPAERFAEDGLRTMRAIRFAAVLDFEVEPETLAAIPGALGVFQGVAMERIRDELVKMLAGRKPAKGVELMRATGMLDHVLPGLSDGLDHPQNRFHTRDIYQHAVRSLEKSRGDPILKLAILLHDIGKPATAAGPPGEHTFYGHEQESARMADAIMERLRFSNRDRQRVVGTIGNHMFHYEPGWTDGAVRRLVQRIGPDGLADQWELRRSDAWGRGQGLHATLANLRAIQARIQSVAAADAALKVTDLAIDGAGVMESLGCGPGRQVGDALDFLLEHVLDDPSLNTPEQLVALLEQFPTTAPK